MQSGDIVSYNRGEDCIVIEFASGIHDIFAPPVDGYLAFGVPEGNCITYDALAADLVQNLEDILAETFMLASRLESLIQQGLGSKLLLRR